MKQAIGLALSVLLLTGCAGSRITPTPDSLAAFRGFTIIPVENMPLKISPNGRAEAAAVAAFIRTAPPSVPPAEPAGPADHPELASLAQTAVPWTAAPSLGVRTAASTIGLLVGIVGIVDLIQAGQEVPGAVPSLDPQQRKPLSIPSVAFARYAAARLERPGGPAVHLLDEWV